MPDMKNLMSLTPKSGLRSGALILATATLATTTWSHAATTGWNQTAAGTFDYNTAANWADSDGTAGPSAGDINGIWDSSLTLAGTQTLTFGADTALGTGLSFLYDGGFNETFRSDGVANRSLTLGGNILVNTVSASRTVTFGSSTANQKLDISLGGATRTFDVRAAVGNNNQRSLTFLNGISNGSLVLQGSGNVNFSSATAQTYSLGALTLKNTQLTANNFSDINISGALTIDSGAGLTASGAGGISVLTLSAGNSRNHAVTAASLVRSNNAVALFRGTSLGTSAPGTINTASLTFSTAPTAQLVGGGGAAGTTSISILPWGLGGTSTSTANTFVTYDTTNGIRPLDITTEFATSIVDGAVSTNNVRLTAATTTLNSASTVNSLYLLGDDTTATVVGGTGTLSVTSGAVFLSAANTVTTVQSSVDFGAKQGVIGYGTGKGTAWTGAVAGTGGVVLYQANPYASFGSGGTGISISGNATSSTYTGDTYVHGRANISPGFLPSGSRTGDLYITGVLEMNGGAINGLNGNGYYSKASSGTATLSLGGNDANGNFSGIIQSGSGTLLLTKTGAGTQILSGANTYSGATSVAGGTLLINGSTVSSTTVSSTATLGGTGTIGNNVTVNAGGFLAPGASIESLEVTGNATLNGTLKIELDGAGSGSSDLLAVGGILNITNATLDFSQLSPVNDSAYVFATYGTLTGSAFASVNNLPAGYSIDYNYQSGNAIAVVVPEPAMLGTFAGLGLMMIARRRGNRR